MTTQNRTVPALRFSEFNSDWEEKKLGETASFTKGKGISKFDVAENGEFECIRYGELYTHYGETIQNIRSKTNLSKKDLVFSELNDVIIPASGETQIDIATASCVLKEGVALGGDLNIIKSKQNGVFLSYYLNNRKKMEIASLAQGSSVVHLYSSQLKTLPLNLPTLPEQQKIAAFLTAVDEKIQQLAKKKNSLEQYKKGVMQKIFNQEIRFKDDNGKDFADWELTELKEIAVRVTAKNKSNDITNVLTNSATKGIVNQQDYFDKDIANQNNLQGYYIVEKDDFVYNPRISTFAPVGPIKRNNLDKGLMSPLYSVFRFKKVNLDFIEQFFETRLWHDYLKSIANYGARHDRMNITVENFFDMPILLPLEPEQKKIAAFLSAIDDKINLVNQQLEKTRNFKKGLLQQMFV